MRANRALAELKGIAHTIPNEGILMSSLSLQEAKDSSAVENIVTTHDDLYSAGLQVKHQAINAATKEVFRYREAISIGFDLVKRHGLLTLNTIKEILRPLFGPVYKHELLNDLFFRPYTKIELMEKDMVVQRKTATKYLDVIVQAGVLNKVKIGRENYYINTELVKLLMDAGEDVALKAN